MLLKSSPTRNLKSVDSWKAHRLAFGSVSPQDSVAKSNSKGRFATYLKRLAANSQERLAEQTAPRQTYITSKDRSGGNIFAIAKAFGIDPRRLLAPRAQAGAK